MDSESPCQCVSREFTEAFQIVPAPYAEQKILAQPPVGGFGRLDVPGDAGLRHSRRCEHRLAPEIEDRAKDRQFKWGFRAVRASEVTLEEGRLGVGREMREVRPGAAGLKMSRRGPGVLLARMGCVRAAQRRRQMDG